MRSLHRRLGPRSVYAALALGFILATSFSTASAAANQTVIGSVEGIDAVGVVFGWALDPDTPSAAVDLHVYVEGPAGAGGRLIGVIPASIPRSDIPYPGPHGFRYLVPRQYWDRQAHRLYVYAIDSAAPAASNAQLSGSPQVFRRASTTLSLDNGFVRIGVEPRCGGTLAELSVNGANLINNADCTGRQVQMALYDGNQRYDACAACTGVWGWNPVQGGDKYNFGSPSLTVESGPDFIRVITRPYEWNPDDKGGGPGRPVLSDVLLEQQISFVPNHPRAVRLHYKLTHLADHARANALQEFPAVYVNLGYDRFIYYGGEAPWTNGAVSSTTLSDPSQPVPQHYAPERWSALVNDRDIGLTVFVPGQYPYVAGVRVEGTSGPFGSGANFFRPHIPLTLGPGSTFEGDIYLIAGNYKEARRAIYALNASVPARDILPPFGYVDAPAPGQRVGRTILVSGWAFDDTEVAAVEVLVDGVLAGTARYGEPRPDVATVFPNAPASIGFSFSLDTTKYSNGPHRVTVRVTDGQTVAVLPDIDLTVENSKKPARRRAR